MYGCVAFFGTLLGILAYMVAVTGKIVDVEIPRLRY